MVPIQTFKMLSKLAFKKYSICHDIYICIVTFPSKGIFNMYYCLYKLVWFIFIFYKSTGKIGNNSNPNVLKRTADTTFVKLFFPAENQNLKKSVFLVYLTLSHFLFYCMCCASHNHNSSDVISATRSLRSLMADITSSLMDKNHIQIHPWYNLYIYGIYILGNIAKCQRHNTVITNVT